METDIKKPIFVIVLKEAERYSAESILQAIAGITLRLYDRWLNTDIYLTDPAKHPLNRWERLGSFFTVKTATAEQWNALAKVKGMIHVSDGDTSAWSPGIFYEDQIQDEIFELADLTSTNEENVVNGKESFVEPMFSIILKKNSEDIGLSLMDRADSIVRFIPRLYLSLNKPHRDLWANGGYVVHVFEEDEIEPNPNNENLHMAVANLEEDVFMAGYFIHTHSE